MARKPESPEPPEPFVRVSVTSNRLYDAYYPTRCCNDACTHNAKWYFGWGTPNYYEGACSLTCWLKVDGG